MFQEDSEQAELPWPGFVDILSAVLIVFVFMVMIITIIISVSNFDHQSKMRQESEEQLESELSSLKQRIFEQLSQGASDMNKDASEIENVENKDVDTVQAITGETESSELSQLKADIAKATDQDSMFDQVTDSFYIFYNANEVTLTEDSIAAIMDFTKANSAGAQRFVIEVSDNPEAPFASVAREISLSRSLNIRNALLKAKLPTASISIRYLAPEKVTDSFNWVRIKLVK